MEILTTSDIETMTDICSQQLSPTEVKLFALKQDLDIAKVFISVMRTRHQIEILN